MNPRSVLFCTLFVLAGIAPSLTAQTSTAAATPEKDTTELGEKMSALSKAFKKLRLQVADPAKNEDSLKLVATMQESAKASEKLLPEKMADVPEANQNEFKQGFARKMQSLQADIGKLEDALKAGNNEEAKKLVDAMGDAQKEGHKEYRKKKPEKK